MVYDLNKEMDRERARTRLEFLISKAGDGKSHIVELTEKKPKRSLSQNAYLHLILAYFASQTGNTLDWVKTQYYKLTCSPDIFVTYTNDKYIGPVKGVRSSASLTTEEMSISIERFRNWSSMKAGIYIPEAHSEAEITAMEQEVERYKTYLYGD